MQKNIKNLYRTLIKDRITTVAGAWVYYFLTALIPFAFLLITAFSVFGVDFSKEIVSRLPEEFRLAGQTIAKTAENVGGGVTVFFVFTVIFSCTTLLNQMSKDGDFIYGQRSNKKRGFLRRLWAVVALCFLFVVFLGLAMLFSFRQAIMSRLTLTKLQTLLTWCAFSLFLLAVGFILIAILNGFISPVKLKLSVLAVGSFLSLFIITLGTIGFIIYLRVFASYNKFYGSLATVIIFLLWAYILMLGLLLGVIVNKFLHFKGKENF